jgi:hypothetical protein
MSASRQNLRPDRPDFAAELIMPMDRCYPGRSTAQFGCQFFCIRITTSRNGLFKKIFTDSFAEDDFGNGELYWMLVQGSVIEVTSDK